MSTNNSVPSHLLFDVQVTHVRQPSPNFVRVTLSGEDLVDFDCGGPLGTRDTRLKVIIPADGNPRSRREVLQCQPLRCTISSTPTTMVAALWRESPVPRLAPGERLATMASLLHRDADGRALVTR